jgi:branched-chain amino acid transport system substrate-binding protein
MPVRVKLHLEFDPTRADLSQVAAQAIGAGAQTVIVIAGARSSARAVKALRTAGYTGAIAGGPAMGQSSFIEDAGHAAEGVRFPWVGEPAAAFCQRFAARFGAAPDYQAASTYDSVRILAAAIHRAGLNRARIRDAIASTGPYDGAVGRIEWDEFGQNRSLPVLATINSGRPSRGTL